ncbi:hypothetical protein BJY04DRAFT_99261 [Aspergillus karnatakaensis]|uniref:uncharacterized protein n=1 Tax=Aspergillus karnatakaensis TaxID=1810916 RepID=UPI003CCDDB73
MIGSIQLVPEACRHGVYLACCSLVISAALSLLGLRAPWLLAGRNLTFMEDTVEELVTASL